MAEQLRDPVLFPNWVWLLGLGLIVLAAAWGIGLLVAYRRSSVGARVQLHSLSEVRRMRYDRLIGQIEQDFHGGRIGPREAHLSISALIRAAASERMGTNMESVSVEMARSRYASWPTFADALAWCEQPSFADPADSANSAGTAEATSQGAVQRGLAYARQVVRE